MGIPENIDALLVKYDINQDQLAQIADVTPGAVTGWRKRFTPRKDAVRNICDYFNLSEDDILSENYGLAAKEHGSGIGPRRAVGGIPIGYAPLKCRVRAGASIATEALDERGGMVLCPQFLIDRYPDIWAERSEGDCMSNVFPENCIYFVTALKPHQSDRPEVWTIDSADTVARRVFQTSETLLLSPDSTNPENKDIIIRADDDHYAEYDGAIVWFQSNGEVE